MSWEFRRNLWTQLSPHRLIATPLVLGLLFLASAKGGTLHAAPGTVFWLFAGFWGTRRAADSIVEEVAGGTWASQRMAAIGAWSMTWGKLFGATAFAWYGALLAWLVYAGSGMAEDQLSIWPVPSPGTLVSMLVFALLAHAVSLLTAMVQMRRRRRGRQIALGLAQLAGLLAIVPFFVVTEGFVPIRQAAIAWYGYPLPAPALMLFSALAFLAWSVVAIHQLMRDELQYRDVSWRLPLFAVFLLVYVAGLVPTRLATPFPSPVTIAAAGAAMLTLFYATLLSAPGDAIGLMRWGSALRRGQWRLTAELMPPWIPAAALLLVVGLTAIQQAAVFDDWLQTVWPSRVDAGGHVANWIGGTLAFAARDALVVVLFAVGRRPERADINAVIWLAILHGLMPLVMLAVGLGAYAGTTTALPGASSTTTLAAALGQVALLAVFLIRRLAKLRPAGVRPVP